MISKLFFRLMTTISRLALTFCLICYIIIPLLVLCFPSIPAILVFLNMVGWPPARFCNFNDPEKNFGLKHSQNVYIQSAPGVKLGIWRINPNDISESDFNHHPVILYLHGNSAHRASAHRVQLYKLLASLGYYVVCFDYRGYGDSTGTPSEVGLVHDAMTVYKWILNKKGSSKIFIWGHSLGTGVAAHLGRRIFELDSEVMGPDGIILESPFNNLKDEVREHKFAKPFKWLPYFERIFLGAFDRVNVKFQSDHHVQYIRCPLLFLHADDDIVIPYKLGEKLYQASKLVFGRKVRVEEDRKVSEGLDIIKVQLVSFDSNMPDANTDKFISDENKHLTSVTAKPKFAEFYREFVGFTGRAGYSHKWLVKAPELPLIVKEFVGY